ncbi:membrane protein insertase YidC [Corynebacterium callunae]|uniref:membrane protein insertase YidC n=1 Tax=Corynebacterium callunae TaxID=1721 RepID=UPI0039829734
MLDILIYPVSGVMKLWHLLLHNVFGMDDSLAWVISLFGLVITIRAIIAPFTWTMLKTGRKTSQLRPKRKAIEAEYAGKHDEASIREMQKRLRDLNKEEGVNPFAGCVPILIQTPVIIGLYSALLQMARPAGGLENPVLQPVGFLSTAEVQSFLEGRINNVPLPAYVSMPAEQLAYLGTTKSEVLDFVLPLFIAAAIFTAINMVISLSRSYQTNNFGSGFSNGLFKVMVVLSIISPIFPLSLGLTGPFPMAIALYWVSNNLWTFTQNAVMTLILHKKHPLTEEFKAHQREQREEYRAATKEKREFLGTRRKNRLMMVLQPWKAAELHAVNVALTSERNEKIKAEKAARKEIVEKRRETQRQMNRESMEKLKQRRAQVRAQKAKAQKAGPRNTASDAGPTDFPNDSNDTGDSGSSSSDSGSAGGSDGGSSGGGD